MHTVTTHTGSPPLSAEDVADMLVTLEAANLDRTIADLDTLLACLRPAAAVRDQLARVDHATLRAALALRSERRGSRR